MHRNFSQVLLKDHFLSSQIPEHTILINWTQGNIPATNMCSTVVSGNGNNIIMPNVNTTVTSAEMLQAPSSSLCLVNTQSTLQAQQQQSQQTQQTHLVQHTNYH